MSEWPRAALFTTFLKNHTISPAMRTSQINEQCTTTTQSFITYLNCSCISAPATARGASWVSGACREFSKKRPFQLGLGNTPSDFPLIKVPCWHSKYCPTQVHPVTPRVHPRVYPGVPGVPRKTSGVYKRCTTNKCTNTAPKHLEYSPKKPGVTKSQIGVAQLKTPALHHTPALHPALHPDYTPDYTPGELLLFLDLPIINLKASL